MTGSARVTLRSKLFAGDDRLQAAANLDQAHIVQGASGPHVSKIQLALMVLDGAAIDGRELRIAQYGPSTASAALAFKTKRQIINRSYQSKADNIVGKMTIAALDAEMVAIEAADTGPTRLKAIAPKRDISEFGGAPSNPRPSLLLNFAFDGSAVKAPPQPPPGFDRSAIDLNLFGTGTFEVVNGIGGTVNCDPNIASMADRQDPLSGGSTLPVRRNPQTFSVRGINPGVTLITFQKLFASPFSSLVLPIAVIVRAPVPKPQRPFVRGGEHNHAPCGKWAEIQASPRNAVGGVSEGLLFDAAVMTAICKACSNPRCVIDKVISLGFDPFPIAKDHIDWYLRSGHGRDFDEDGNIELWLKTDGGIRATLRSELSQINDKTGKKTGHFEFEQSGYKNDDFKNSFGGIDRVDFEFDFTHDECSVWFQDRYEWHPFYKGLYTQFKDDDPRATNCVHAAFVELKTQGAADFWMKGQATVPLSLILKK